MKPDRNTSGACPGDARQVGKDLDVRAVVSGRVVQSGDALSVSVELVDARDNRHLWGQQYRRARGDLLGMQEEISRDLVEELGAPLSAEQQRRVEKRHTDSPEAYLLYLKGRLYWKRSSEEEYRKAEPFFQRAIAIDPNYSLAWVGLADFHGFGASQGMFPPAESWPKAEAAVKWALELDPSTAEVHNTLAGLKLGWYRDYPGVEDEFRRTIELNPNHAEVYNNYGGYLTLRGRFDEAIAARRRALTLDPLSIRYNSFLGHAMYFARRYDQAIDQLHKSLELDPNDIRTHELLARSYALKGMAAESIAEWERVLTLKGAPDAAALVRRTFGEQGFEAAMKTVGRLRRDELQRRLARGQYVPAFHFVGPNVQLGDFVAVREWLERAAEERNRLVLFVAVDPEVDPVRDEPWFQAILRGLNLA